ncbi:MAG: FAD-dependent oxidoreductase [Oscillospiraceae bacterium]
MNASIWSETVPKSSEKSNPLLGNITTDVAIIGGGIAGLLTAYFLHQKGINYILIEADEVGKGVSANTTAKITSLHNCNYQKLIKNFGVTRAKQYLQANEFAIKQYKKLSETFPCDFEEKSAYIYSTNNKEKIISEVTALKKLGANAQFVDKLPLPFPICGAVKLDHQAQFHPLKFMQSIAKNLHIYNHTMAKSIDGCCIKTDYATIHAKKIVMTTHFPFINAPGFYFLKMYQERSYVLALENAQQVDGMYLDESKSGYSFRNHGNLLLMGGGSHRTGKQKKEGGFFPLQYAAKQYYPHSTLAYNWATQDCISLDSIPYIGAYAKKTPNLFVATGFNKWGMTSSMVSAMILSDLITGHKNPYSDVFSPKRFHFIASFKNLVYNLYETTIGFLSFQPKRCPHLGCALNWNKQERTWDCPCHGSRFSDKGNLINNPSIRGFNHE